MSAPPTMTGSWPTFVNSRTTNGKTAPASRPITMGAGTDPADAPVSPAIAMVATAAPATQPTTLADARRATTLGRSSSYGGSAGTVSCGRPGRPLCPFDVDADGMAFARPTPVGRASSTFAQIVGVRLTQAHPHLRSVRARKHRRLCSRRATADTGARRFKPLELILEREDAERGAGCGLDLAFAGGRAAPAGDEEAALGSIDVDELVPAGDPPRVGALE